MFSGELPEENPYVNSNHHRKDPCFHVGKKKASSYINNPSASGEERPMFSRREIPEAQKANPGCSGIIVKATDK
ncbi:MAG: hypothetical protein ACKO85_09305 [Isosphaeraceae bacterium]